LQLPFPSDLRREAGEVAYLPENLLLTIPLGLRLRGLTMSPRLSLPLVLMGLLAACCPVAAAASTVAFYAPWDARGAASLKGHRDRIDWLAPVWVSVTGPNDQFVAEDAAAAKAVGVQAGPRPRLMPLVQNAKGGVWDGAGAAALLASPVRRKALIDKLDAALRSYGARGVMFDLEDLPPAAQSGYLALLGEARARFGQRWTVAVTVPAGNPDWPLSAYAKAADLLILMAYDQHWQTGAAGPIAPLPWFAQVVGAAASQVPPGKLVVGLASYAYDWPKGGAATPLSVSDAEALAAAKGAKPVRDSASGELHFSYAAAGVPHEVWLVDAQASRAQDGELKRRGLRSSALWRLGVEDPGVWAWFGRP
jgi:spore germination protein YaaH